MYKPDTSSRRWIILMMAVFALVFVALLWPQTKVTPETARERAISQFQRFTRDAAIDGSRFVGPKETSPPANSKYAFEWNFADTQDKVTIFVWVAKDGWTDVTWEGDLERLRDLL
ncbi:MAG TPA: hypothetical protein VGH50_04810 [Candidatus Binatia bacterium]|jgi:hypothetical protein